MGFFLGPSVVEVRPEAVQMCPRYPDPVPLDHPIPILKDALEKVCDGEADGVWSPEEGRVPSGIWEAVIHLMILGSCDSPSD